MKRLPLNLQKEGVFGESKPKMTPYCVHMIDLDSLYKSSDGYVYMNSKRYGHTDATRDLREPAKIEILADDPASYIGRNRRIFIPITSFDGYNVLLLENCSKRVMDEITCKPLTCNTAESLDPYEYWFIDAYSLCEVEFHKLSGVGKEQLRKALESLEDYETLAKYFG